MTDCRDRRAPQRGDRPDVPKHQPDAGVTASPSLPSLERDVLGYWAGDKTFPG